MIRKLFTALLVLVLTLCAVPFTASAESGLYSWTGSWETDWGVMTLTQSGTTVTGIYDHDEGHISGTVSGSTLTGTWSESPSYAPPNDAGDVEFYMSQDGKSFTGQWRYGSEGAWGTWDGGVRNGEPVLTEQPFGPASEWAVPELRIAAEHGLIPDILKDADLTRSITRAEFAAVGVRLHEVLSGTTAAPASASTFTDTRDTEVLKAYALDIIGGVGGGKFDPNGLLNREQAATILTRVYKKLNWENWTLAGDTAYTAHSLDNKGVLSFADDASISDWAKPSVYFMAKYEIIKGLGNNKFGPRNTTSAETATGYANSTREQSLLMSNRTFDKADIIVDGGPVTVPTSASIVGTWRSGDKSRPSYIGSIDSNVEYTFNANGSYTQIAITSVNYIYSCTAYKGSYTISNGTITVSNRSKATFGIQEYDWSEAHTAANSAKYVSVENAELTLTVTDMENIAVNTIALYHVR